jgi:hypothetical protein
MKTLSFLLFALAAQVSVAQTNSWKVYHNGRVKVQTSTENESKNSFTITKADLEETGFLWVIFSDKTPTKGWKRSIAAYDEKDNELHKHGGILFKMTNPQLLSFFNRVKTIKIYTWALPADPKEAARIRVRRIHLATIRLVD